jgi:tetratricopeptide (TPR) repeat protein
LLGGAICLRKHRPLASFALASFFLCLAPVSHLVPFPTLFAERFLYLPIFFLLLAVMDLLSWLLVPASGSNIAGFFPALWRRLALGLGAIIFLFWGGQGVWRGRVFHDELAFWRAAAAQVPDRAVVRNWLGIAYRNAGDLARARQQYLHAAALDPSFTMSRMNLAEILMIEGKADEAAALLEELLAGGSADSHLYFNLGMVYERQHRDEDAARCYQAALRLDPSYFPAHYRLALHFLARGDCQKAEEHFHALTARSAGGSFDLDQIERLLKERCP